MIYWESGRMGGEVKHVAQTAKNWAEYFSRDCQLVSWYVSWLGRRRKNGNLMMAYLEVGVKWEEGLKSVTLRRERWLGGRANNVFNFRKIIRPKTVLCNVFGNFGLESLKAQGQFSRAFKLF